MIDDREPKRNFDELVQFFEQLKHNNEYRRYQFESVFHKVFCILPKRSTSGKWIWLKHAYIRYEAIKKNFIRVDSYGSLEVTVTDPIAHYMCHEYEPGKPLEILTESEYKGI